MSFTPRVKPSNIFNTTFKPYDNPKWDDLNIIPWDAMEYTWDFFVGLATYINRTKPTTIFTNI